MSFYPQRGRSRRTIVAAAVGALLVGLVVGALAGRATAPSLSERVGEVRDEAAAIGVRLAVLETEYPQAVRGGQVVGPIEYAGARARVEAAGNALGNVAPRLRIVDPRGLAEARRGLVELRRAMDARASPAAVSALIRRVRRTLDPAP